MNHETRRTASTITDVELTALYDQLAGLNSRTEHVSGQLAAARWNRDLNAQQLRDVIAERNRLAVELGQSERTITETAEMLRAALRRLERGRD